MAGNTTPISGTVCRVSVDGTNNIEHTTGWVFTETVESHDTTAQGSTYRSKISGLLYAAGSITGYLVADSTKYQYAGILNVLHGATPDPTPSSASKFFLEDSGDYYSCSIIITGLTITSRVGDTVNWSMSFESTGQIDLTVA